jgi:hypothetical protein
MPAPDWMRTIGWPCAHQSLTRPDARYRPWAWGWSRQFLLPGRGSRCGQAASRETAAAPQAAICAGRAGSAGRCAGVAARELPRGARRTHARATVDGQGAGAARESALCDGAVSLAVAGGTGTALGRFFAWLARALAPLRGVVAPEHALGDAPALAGAAVIVRLAALVLVKTAAGALAAAVAATVPGTTVLRLCATLGNHLAAGQGLARAHPVCSHLTQPRATIGGVVAALASHPASLEQEAASSTLADGPASPTTTLGIGPAVLAGHAAFGTARGALAAGAVARAAFARSGASTLLLNAEATPTGCIARITPQAATRTSAGTDQPVAGTARLRSACELPAAVLLAEVRAAVFGALAGGAFGRTDPMAALTVAARARATRIAVATRGAVAQAEGQRRTGELDVA